MNNILSIKVGSSNKKVYLQNGFYDREFRFSPLHSHNYSEIHVVASGRVKFSISGKEETAEAGSIIMIPPKIFHWVMTASDDVRHIAFQIEHTSTAVKLKKLSVVLLSELLDEIAAAYKNNDYTAVSAYLSLICCKLIDTEKERPTPISDYDFLIYEFFSNRYNEDVKLGDLAKELHLSEKQTQRLVKKYTGKTFGSNLTERRIAMAEALFESYDFLKSDVCERVGYHSYGGFFKAYKKYVDNLSEE